MILGYWTLEGQAVYWLTASGREVHPRGVVPGPILHVNEGVHK